MKRCLLALCVLLVGAEKPAAPQWSVAALGELRTALAALPGEGLPTPDAAELDAAWRAVRAAAGEAGARPEEAAVRAFYAVQIEAAKFVQARELAGADAASDAPDLQQALRPALLRIGQRMAALVVALHRAGVPPDIDRRLADELRSWALPAALLTRLAAATAALAPVAERAP